MENRRIEVSWACPDCEVGGRDPADDADGAGTGPSCWNCGGPVVVADRPPVRRWTRPDAA